MKYICVGYMEKGKFEDMTEGEQQSTHGKAAIFRPPAPRFLCRTAQSAPVRFLPTCTQPGRCRNSGCAGEKAWL